MSLIKLRFSMIGTITLLTAVSTVFFAILFSFFGVGNLLSLAFMVIFSNLAQWLARARSRDLIKKSDCCRSYDGIDVDTSKYSETAQSVTWIIIYFSSLNDKLTGVVFFIL